MPCSLKSILNTDEIDYAFIEALKMKQRMAKIVKKKQMQIAKRRMR